MLAGLIYHSAETVPTDAISIAVDLLSTCLLTFTVTAFFVRASLKSTKTIAIAPPVNKAFRIFAKLYSASKKGIIYPLRFGIPIGLITAIVLYAIIAPLFALFKIPELPFYIFVLLKSLSCMLFGSGVTVFEMYTGMCKPED